jgi:hypothetical protein
MQTVTTIGLDIAKSVFQIHGVDADGKVALQGWQIFRAAKCRSWPGTAAPPMRRGGSYRGNTGHDSSWRERRFMTQSDTSRPSIVALRNWWVEAFLMAQAHGRGVTFGGGLEVN